jgi:hypothetical protein
VIEKKMDDDVRREGKVYMYFGVVQLFSSGNNNPYFALLLGSNKR